MGYTLNLLILLAISSRWVESSAARFDPAAGSTDFPGGLVKTTNKEAAVVNVPDASGSCLAQPDRVVVEDLTDPINGSFELKLAAVVRATRLET